MRVSHIFNKLRPKMWDCMEAPEFTGDPTLENMLVWLRHCQSYSYVMRRPVWFTENQIGMIAMLAERAQRENQ